MADPSPAAPSPQVASAGRAAGRGGALWRQPDFLRLWGAQAVSAAGSQVTLLALPLTAVAILHAKPFEVALLATAETLPNLLVGIPGGVWLDRVRRRPVMVAADVGRAAMLASAPLAYALGALTLAQLYVIAVVTGSLSVLFEIAAQAYLPSIVARPQLIDANAKLEASRVVAWAAGPGAGGGLVSLVGAPVALLADAASFVVSGSLIRSVSHREEKPTVAPGETSEARQRLGAVARDILRDPYQRPLLLGHALANLALGLVWAIAIVYAVRTLGLSAASVGAVLSLGQIGGASGAVFGRRVAARLGVGRTLATAFFLFGPATLALAVAPRQEAIVFLAVGWTLENLARALYGVCATSIRQALVPAELQARVTGLVTAAGTGAFPVGTALGGALAGLLGLRQAMLAAALVSFLPFIPVAASRLRLLAEVS